MPEFILQEYKHPLGTPPQRIIFTKNEYCHRVKMPGWDRAKESEPKDNDPYDPPGGNQFLSTYLRLGHQTEQDHFVTSTGLSLEQIHQKEKYFLKPDKKPMIHYITFQDKCHYRATRRCPVSDTCANDYSTTMQDGYRIPKPCTLQPLSVPKPPFLQNRILKWEEPELDECKFYDESCIQKIKALQKIKGFRMVSYDPITQMHSDRTPVKTIKRTCVELPFKHVK